MAKINLTKEELIMAGKYGAGIITEKQFAEYLTKIRKKLSGLPETIIKNRFKKMHDIASRVSKQEVHVNPNSNLLKNNLTLLRFVQRILKEGPLFDKPKKFDSPFLKKKTRRPKNPRKPRH